MSTPSVRMPPSYPPPPPPSYPIRDSSKVQARQAIVTNARFTATPAIVRASHSGQSAVAMISRLPLSASYFPSSSSPLLSDVKKSVSYGAISDSEDTNSDDANLKIEQRLTDHEEMIKGLMEKNRILEEKLEKLAAEIHMLTQT